MSQNEGVVAFIPLFIFGVVAIITIGLLLIYKGAIRNPIPGIVKIPTESQVELAADYKNPLDKEAQYTNPFSGYKNPFDALK